MERFLDADEALVSRVGSGALNSLVACVFLRPVRFRLPAERASNSCRVPIRYFGIIQLSELSGLDYRVVEKAIIDFPSERTDAANVLLR